MSGRLFARLALVVLLCVGAGPALRLIGQGKAPSTAQEEAEGETDYSLPHRLNLPVNSAPVSILSFYLAPRIDDVGEYQWPVRLAVLSALPPAAGVGLQIFKPEGTDKLATAFSIRPPETEGWGKLEPFPSDYSYPGLVIRGNYTELAKHGGPLTVAICYFNGTFRVAFRGGYTTFIPITEGKMPEAVEYVSAEEESRANTRVRVWTWDGKKYQPVAEITYKALFSAQLMQAIKAVQEQGKAVTAPSPKAKRP